MTTTPETLRWFPALFGGGRYCYLDADKRCKVTELPAIRSIPALFVVKRMDAYPSYRVVWSEVHPTLEAAIEAGLSS